ncbi:MAG TPA: PQQ-binding-like beta-propeller repeat protein [Gemmataceae bacterium]|jgi:WD40 repeat protein
MIDRAMHALVLFTLMIGLPQSGLLGAEPLPPRALARIGDHRFYHGPGLRCAVLSPDGRRIASAASDSVIVLWDAATGERLRALRAPQGFVSHLAFSPDGKRLAAAYVFPDRRFGVALFDVETGKLLWQRKEFESVVLYLQFSTDGQQLRVSEGRGPVSAWDAATGKQLRLWKPPSETRPAADEKRVGKMVGMLSPDGKVIVWEVCHLNEKEGGISWNTVGLRVHNAVTDKLLYQKKFQCKGMLEGFAFSSDSKRFAAKCDKLTVWATAAGKELAVLKVPEWTRIALTPDGRRAAIDEPSRWGTWRGFKAGNRLRLWDIETGKPSLDLLFSVPVLKPFFDASGARLAFSADGKTLLFGADSTLRLFDTKTGEERVVPGHRAPVTPRFSADGRTLFTSCAERRCRWDVSSGKQPTLLRQERRQAENAGCLAYSADERLFVDNVVADGRFRVREATTGRVLRELETDGQNAFEGWFSPDASQVLLLKRSPRSRNGFPDLLQLYDAKTGKKLAAIEMDIVRIDPAISPNGRLVAWTDGVNAVHLHDAVTGKVLRTLRFSKPLPESADHRHAQLLFSPDGEQLIVATYDNTSQKHDAPQPMRVFQVSSGREIIRFYANPEKKSEAGPLSYMDWSPDGRLLAVAEERSGIVHLLEIASGKVRAEFAGHRHGVHGLAFAPDGRTLASGGEDNVVFLWDVTGARTPAAVTKTPAEWWSDLAREDGKRAGDAIAGLLRKPEASVAFLQQRLRPAEVPDAERLTRLLSDLDGDVFDKRKAASRELARLGEQAETALRQALKEHPSLEARRRIEDLLNKLEPGPLSPETLRTLRAIEILEHLGTPEARRCLNALVKGAPLARETREAKRALDRLAKRPDAASVRE